MAGDSVEVADLVDPDAQGEAAWNLAVPNDPTLVGLTVWMQVASEANDGTWGAGPFFSVPDALTVVP